MAHERWCCSGFANNDLEYEVSYRSGGGIAIAALAMASSYPVSGEFTSANYLQAAEDAFEYIEQNNLKLVNDDKENIVDDYCAAGELPAQIQRVRAFYRERRGVMIGDPTVA